MNHDRNRPDAAEHEQALLAHFRAHADGEPSAELDARILAAAQATARDTRQAKASPGLGQRLHQWLFGSGRQRWSVALAGMACLGIGVSLTWRTQQQVPEAYDAPAPAVAMAPMSARSAPQSAPMAEALVIPEADEVSRPAQLVSMPSGGAPASAGEFARSAAPLARMVSKAEPRDALLQLLALRRAGENEQAKKLQAQLEEDFPQLDIEAELSHLLKEP